MNFVDSLYLTLALEKRENVNLPFELSSVRQWNDNVEAYCSNHASGSSTTQADIGKLGKAVSLMSNSILSSIFMMCAYEEADSCSTAFLTSAAESDDDADADEAARTAASFVRAHVNAKDEGEMIILSELIRASKNILRYNSQIITPQLESQPDEPFMLRLSSPGMLELYLAMIRTRHADLARFASLALFYSTYNPMDDSFIERSRTYLVTDLNFLKTLAELLLQARPTDFVLTLVRHVHNLVTTVQGASDQISTFLKPNEECDAPWLEDLGGSLDLPSLLVGLVNWCLASEPTFPHDRGDRRADVVSISLRILFALRAGASLLSSNGLAKQTVVDILQLNSRDDDYRASDWKNGVVAVLMDAPPDFTQYLVQHQCMDPLLSLFGYLVSDVVDNRKSGSHAATTLTPILVVLNNASAGNSEALRVVRDFVFPPECEASFQEKVQEELCKNSNEGIGAKNMTPLDAPRGTLRWKLTRLQTWTESHTKRLTNELLWTLCGSDAREFVLRTGFGNAMPFLANKGVVSLPAQMPNI